MSENENGNATLYAKLARITGKTRRISKEGRNDYFKYDFVTDADVLDFFRPLLAEENVALLPRMVSVEQLEIGTGSSGAKKYKTRAKFEFTLVCGDSGASYTCEWFSEAMDNEDKGISKAATAALKYWLLKTFMASTGDLDEDADATGEDGKTQATTKPAQPKAPAKVTTLEPESKTVIAAVAETKEYKKKNGDVKQMVVYHCDSNIKASDWSTKHAKEAGYDVTSWGEIGTRELNPPALLTIVKEGDFWNVTDVKRTDALESTGTDGASVDFMS